MGAELLKIYQMLESISGKLNKLEAKMEKMDAKMDQSLAIQRNHLIRIKNNQTISDDMILLGRPYNDLSPQDAYRIFSNPDLEYIFLDVSYDDYQPGVNLEGAIKIPLEDLPQQYQSIINNKTPIIIISEDGLRSILACEFLIKKGYFNVNNVSGGYEFWPERQSKDVDPEGHAKENIVIMKDKSTRSGEGMKKKDIKSLHTIDETEFDTKLWEEGKG